MGSNWTGTWAGGRVRQGRNGIPQYVIDRMVVGRRFFLVLDAKNELEAGAQLSRFLQDPDAFHTKGDETAKVEANAVVIDKATVEAYLKHLVGHSAKYIHDSKGYLGWWSDALGGRDLRSLALLDYRAALHKIADRKTGVIPGEKYRITVIKAFCSWLRSEGRLSRTQDATLDLVPPAPKVGKALDARCVPIADFEAIYSRIDSQLTRDLLCLRAKTGAHHTELGRLARGQGRIVPLKNQCEIAGVLVIDHKRGTPHTISVDAPALGAAVRLRKAGRAPGDSWVHKCIDRGVRAATAEGIKVSPFDPSLLRHSRTDASWLERVVTPQGQIDLGACPDLAQKS
jgi:hypothetical protein